jgi:hypothetical protein
VSLSHKVRQIVVTGGFVVLMAAVVFIEAPDVALKFWDLVREVLR